MKMRSVVKRMVALCAILGVASTASATSLTFTDDETPYLGSGNLITYVLDYDESGTGGYDATFSIANSSDIVAPEWYVGWVTIHFGDKGPVITDLSDDSAGTTWSIMTASTEVFQNGTYTNPLQGNAALGFTNAVFYGNSFTDPASLKDGILVTGLASTTNFSFHFAATDLLEEMPFQVGYYSSVTGESIAFVGRLSKDLGTPVPEPGTFLLLGSGLFGLGLLRRRRNS